MFLRTNLLFASSIISFLSKTKFNAFFIDLANDSEEILLQMIPFLLLITISGIPPTLKPTTGVKKDRQKIKDIGFQEIVRDTVIEIKALPEHKKKIDELDVVFNIKEYLESVQFHFSIVSGTHIAKLAEGGETPVKVSKKSKKLLLDGQIRCLGVESGNADKILQYGLYKYIGKDLLKGRRLVMATDSNIPKIKS